MMVIATKPPATPPAIPATLAWPSAGMVSELLCPAALCSGERIPASPPDEMLVSVGCPELGESVVGSLVGSVAGSAAGSAADDEGV